MFLHILINNEILRELLTNILTIFMFYKICDRLSVYFVVEEFIKHAAVKEIDNNQFGTVPKSSTTQALISMFHEWNKETDRTGSTAGVVLFYFKKAFDLIDHYILIRKLSKLGLPP